MFEQVIRICSSPPPSALSEADVPAPLLIVENTSPGLEISRTTIPSTGLAAPAAGKTVRVSNPKFSRGLKLFAKIISQIWNMYQMG